MNKKPMIIIAMILIAAVFTINFNAEAMNSGKTGGSKRMKITIHARCSNTNGVGNEWSQSYTLNGQKIRSGSILEVAPGDKITIAATVRESDPSMDDVGTNQRTITITEKDISSGFSFDMNVVVTENGGRYKGNKAVWNIAISAK